MTGRLSDRERRGEFRPLDGSLPPNEKNGERNVRRGNAKPQKKEKAENEQKDGLTEKEKNDRREGSNQSCGVMTPLHPRSSCKERVCGLP